MSKSFDDMVYQPAFFVSKAEFEIRFGACQRADTFSPEYYFDGDMESNIRAMSKEERKYVVVTDRYGPDLCMSAEEFLKKCSLSRIYRMWKNG